MRNKVVFLHIEKAAGSTVHDIMYANFFPYYVASPVIYIRGEDNQKNSLGGARLNEIFRLTPGLRAAGGHSLRCYDSVDDSEVLYFTFLRDPVSRYLSHYFYQNEVMGIDRKFEEFLGDKVFDNFMCKKISGKDCAYSAIKIIEEKEVFPCLVERFDESLKKLESLFLEEGIHQSFQAGYQVANSRKSRGDGEGKRLDDMKSEYYEYILENNKEDIKLYDYVKERFFSEEAEEAILEMKKGYSARVKLGKLLRRILFKPLERKVGFHGL